MKIKKSKKQQSDELAKAMAEFLHDGGEIKTIPNGTSGKTENINLFKTSAEFGEKAHRTPLTEVVKTLEERKKSKNKTQPKVTRKRSKKLIVDDFGEPLRWIWDD